MARTLRFFKVETGAPFKITKMRAANRDALAIALSEENTWSTLIEATNESKQRTIKNADKKEVESHTCDCCGVVFEGGLSPCSCGLSLSEE